MIITHDESGRITSTVNDPVPSGTADRYEQLGIAFIEAAVAVDPAILCGGHWIAGGVLAARPACPAQVSLNGRTISLSAVPDGSVVRASFDDIAVTVEADTIELDEAGPLRITILPPWPFLEAVHDLEIE